MFADRPQRMTANIATQALIDEWNKGQRNFEKDPPNANLSMLVDGKEQNTVVELTNPKLSGDTLTYDARLLYGEHPQDQWARHPVHRLVGGTEWRRLPTLWPLAYRALRAELRAVSAQTTELDATTR